MIARLALAAVLVLASLAPAARSEPHLVNPGLTGAASDCSGAAVAKARAAFADAYRRKDWWAAQEAIEPVWRGCFAQDQGPPVLRAEVSNDYALLLHHSSDDRDCLEILLAYGPGRSRPTAEMAALPERLQKAIRFNYGLCKVFCDEGDAYTDAVCAWMRTENQYDRMADPSAFKAAPCPFAAPEGAVALPGKGPARCLALTAPKTPYDYASVDEHAADDICPGVELLTPDGRRTALAVPGRSLLRSKRFCCGEHRLAVDRAGRIEVTTPENPPEDCIFGHREYVVQDVLRLDGGRLRLLSRLHGDD